MMQSRQGGKRACATGQQYEHAEPGEPSCVEGSHLKNLMGPGIEDGTPDPAMGKGHQQLFEVGRCTEPNTRGRGPKHKGRTA